MEYQAFIAAIKADDTIFMRHDSYYDLNTRSWSKNPERHYIEVSWTSGGMTGGSCWGGEHYAVEPDMPEELVDLDKILALVCPNISFLQYKALCATLVKTESYTDSECYGNYYNKIQKILFVDDLYSYLKTHKMLE